MSSQQEQANVQAASDAYVVAHQGALLSDSETDVIYHSATFNYILFASIGRHNTFVKNPV